MDIVAPILKQTSWQIIGKVVTAFSTFIILGLVARNFHEAGIGVFTLSLTYLNIFNLLGDFGFNAHILRKISGGGFQLSGEVNKLLGTRILWSLVLVLIAITTLLFWPFAAPEFSIGVLIGSMAIVASSVFVTCNLIFQSKLRYDLSSLASSLGTLISLILYLYLSTQKYPVPYLLFAYLLGWVLIALISLILVKKFLPKITPIFDFLYIKKLFMDSWPIATTLALNVVYFRIDSFMIAYYKGVSDVGIYNVAYSIFQSALVLPTFIMNAYYPVMLKSLSKVKLVSIILAGLALAGTLTALFLAPFLVKLLTGGAFDGSVTSLRILSLGFPAFFISALLMWFLVTKGQYKQMMTVYFIGLLINFLLNYFFIPQYSFLAASWTTVFSEYLILIMQVFVLRGIIFS